jgi:hypothetical protein
MKGITFSRGFVRFPSLGNTFLEAGKIFDKQRLSPALELSALIVAWSAVMAMSLAVAGLLLGEQ